ncbi:Cullin-4B [Coprinopsis marcescibilis]|uniref:Cullin-4B n=1 Tax=Coprinopsis marcescibilis TaxID=230819 RepID=A0A5C3L6W4_COPMA|nr:Cullin-4B [Coprinopsis marcescibilis]
MALVASLLELPKTSKGLESLAFGYTNDGSASPRRKIARLDTDSDIASRSSSKAKSSTGPFRVQVIGDDTAYRIQAKNVQAGQVRNLKQCINAILDAWPGKKVKDAVHPWTYEKIFATCKSSVTVYDNGPQLYDDMRIGLERAMRGLAENMIGSDKRGIKYVAYFAEWCNWFEGKVALLQSLFTYLDQVYVANNRKTLLSIKEIAYGLYSERIFGNPQIADRLRSSVSQWLTEERDTEEENQDRNQIRELVKFLILHKQYTVFEEYYLEITQLYYEKESKGNAEVMKDDPKAFFYRVEGRVMQEGRRSEDLLPIGSWSIVAETTERALLKDRAEWLANSLVPILMKAEDILTMKLLYKRLARVENLKPLSIAFRNYIRIEVEKIVTDAEHDEDMVTRLLKLKDLCDRNITQAFVQVSSSPDASKTTTSAAAVVEKPDQEFIYALSDAFNLGFRARRNKPAEMIAKYLDKQLRKGQKGVADEAFEAELDKVLPLYRSTEDKDVFRTFYHRMLAKRLLLGKSASEDVEKRMLRELKDKYDPEFGTAEDMFKDLKLSKEMMDEYHSRVTNAESQKLNVMVLQHSAWPFSIPKAVIDLPAEMQTQLTSFTEHYKKRHANHALNWDHALGTVTLRAAFNPGTKELSVSLYQAIVLLLFNEQDELPFKDIKDQTRMEDDDLKRTLQSLACGKKKVLKKIPVGRDVEDSDVFRFNADFTDTLYRVHINTIQAKVSVEETHRTNRAIAEDRKHTLDAAIVRIMKAKKELTFEQLKIATVDAVKSHFVPSMEDIKARIMHLVNSEYLERNPDDKTVFRYLA